MCVACVSVFKIAHNEEKNFNPNIIEMCFFVLTKIIIYDSWIARIVNIIIYIFSILKYLIKNLLKK